MRNRTDAAAGAQAARGAAIRARIFALLRFSLLFWACVNFGLVAVSGFTYLRSIAFGFALLFALWLILGAIFSDGEPIPVPDNYLLGTLAAWSAWSAASVAWSIQPAYSLAELGTEVGWGMATVAIYYVAARTGTAFRAVTTTIVAATVFLALLAIRATFDAGAAGPETALLRSHGGVGAFSTLLVLVAPLLPLLCAPRPAGYGAGTWQIAAVLAAFALLFAAARLTENRMIWVAFAVGFLLAAALAAWRWRTRLQRAPKRWGGILLVLLVALGALFVDAALQRARTDFKGDTTVAQTIAEDPRILLWQHTFERIRERPWIGFGFGKSILRDQLRQETGSPLLLHAHNLFVSQWLQTGAIGVVALLALLGALAWRYWRFLREQDGTLAAIGLAGIVMLVTFVVKNLTDDFMIRPTSKEFWAINALLVGYGIRRIRMASAGATELPPPPQSSSG